jgi:hypothetical protein
MENITSEVLVVSIKDITQGGEVIEDYLVQIDILMSIYNGRGISMEKIVLIS